MICVCQSCGVEAPTQRVFFVQHIGALVMFFHKRIGGEFCRNCVNKYSSKGNYVNRRSCGMPMSEHVQAEISGKTAKLKWTVGAEGKNESETYKVLALLDKQLIAKR